MNNKEKEKEPDQLKRIQTESKIDKGIGIKIEETKIEINMELNIKINYKIKEV
jgi:hypothetical protein